MPAGIADRRRVRLRWGRAGRAVVGRGLLSRGSGAAGGRLDGGCRAAAAFLQRGGRHDSSLAAQGATDRWVMTLALAGVGACHVMTGLALRPAASAGRLILMTGGVATVLVAANPEPAGGRRLAAAYGLGGDRLHSAGGLAARCPEAGHLAPAGLRPAVSASAAGVLLGLLVWFGAELIDGAGRSAWRNGSWPGRRRYGRWQWSWPAAAASLAPGSGAQGPPALTCRTKPPQATASAASGGCKSGTI